MRVFATILAKLALVSARAAAGSGSIWNSYQPKEPDMKKICK